MKILFIGDIFGRTGRETVKQVLPTICEREAPDFVIANCENAAAGAGVTKRIYDELLECSIDVLTSGNHIWNRRDVFTFIDDANLRLLRPANYPRQTPGRGWALFETQSGGRIGVVNLLGRVNLLNVDCPFRRADEAIEVLSKETATIIVDFHGETTSEKVAMGWYLDGRVSAVIGTHTHVPTADGRILGKGTAYLTDAGMTGAMDSVLGLERQTVIKKFCDGLPTKFTQAHSNPGMDWVTIEVQEDGRATSIRHERTFLTR